MTDKKNPELAFDATIRAAAPYQVRRHGMHPEEDMTVIINKDDMREKIRQHKTTATFMFAVDTSGSLIIRNRMMVVKGAILSLLKSHYVKKDRVGFLTFNSEGILLMLPPSRETEVIYKLLDELPVGRKTPLSAAMIYLQEYMTVYMKKHKGEDCYVILVTDGDANVCLDPEDTVTDPIEESREIAKKINIPGVHWVIIDTEKKNSEKHYCKELARILNAGYYTLEDLKADDQPVTTTANYKSFRPRKR